MNEIPIQDAAAVRRRRRYRTAVGLVAVLTLALIMLGAYVRLTDAGLGCPDWPGCYGHLTPAHASEKIAAAVEAQGGEHGPVSMGKAWREMLHRYVASILGLLIIGLAVYAWRWRESLAGGPWLATVLVGVVILQGLFGMWTVTLLLKPAIVTAHLLGGRPGPGCGWPSWWRWSSSWLRSPSVAGRARTTPLWRAVIFRPARGAGGRMPTSSTHSMSCANSARRRTATRSRSRT